MPRVTRSTSRAEAASEAEVKSSVPYGADENAGVAIKFIESEQEKVDLSLQLEGEAARSQGKRAARGRQPLGDIALNAVDDLVVKKRGRKEGEEKKGGGICVLEDVCDGDGENCEMGEEEVGGGERTVEEGMESVEGTRLDVVEEVDEEKDVEAVAGVGSGAEKDVEGSCGDKAIGKMEVAETEATHFANETVENIMNVDGQTDISTSTVLNANGDTTDKQSQTSTPKKRLSLSPPGSTKRPEDSIEAIDELAAAIEELDTVIPSLEPLTSPVKASASTENPNNGPQARISMVPQGQPSVAKRENAPTKSNLSNNMSVKPNVNESARSARPKSGGFSNVSTHRSNTGADRSRSSTAAPKVADRKRSSTSATSKPVDYLASRRPSINLKFPTPPPAPKNVKVPVVPDFKLPSEAIAAKFKAQREERLRKEQEEEAARRKFKARPVPRSISTAGTGTASGPRPTAATKARENLMREAKSGMTESEADARKENSQKTGREGSDAGTLSKRRSMIIASAQNEKRTARRASSAMLPPPAPLASQSSSKRNSLATSSRSIQNRKPGPSAASAVSAASSTSSSAMGRASNARRTSTAKPAAATASAPASIKTAVTPAEVATQRAKAREIFNRDRLAKEEWERERKAKEDAARKARAEAAERGRQISHEWAEKQKQRLAAEKARGAVAKVA